MKRFPVGQRVVCIKDLSGKHPETVQCVGEVIDQLSGLISIISNMDYIVLFPQLNGQPCPRCGKDHGGQYPMAHEELKPLDDPDAGVEEVTSEPLEEPVFGLVTTD